MALIPENEYIPMARKAGITTVLAAPSIGNLLSGQSALMRLDGSDVETMIVKFPVGVHVSSEKRPKLRYGAKKPDAADPDGGGRAPEADFMDAQAYGITRGLRKKGLAYEQKRANKGGAEDRPDRPAANPSMRPIPPAVLEGPDAVDRPPTGWTTS